MILVAVIDVGNNSLGIIVHSNIRYSFTIKKNFKKKK